MFAWQKMDAARVFLVYSGLMSLSFTLVFTVNLFYQAETVGLNPFQLVLVGTVLEATAFVFEIPTGVLADTYSRRLSVILGVVLLGLGILIQGFFPLFGAILLSQLVMGIGYTFISGAGDAWIADEVGVDRAGQVFIQAGQVGRVVGLVCIFISVGLATIHIALPMVVGGVVMLGLAGFLSLFMGETGFTPTPREDRSTWHAMTGTFSDGVKLVRMRPILLSFIFMSLLYGIFSEGFDRLWTPHLLDNFAFPTFGNLEPIVWFGVIDVVGALMGMAGAEVVRRRVDMNHPKQISQTLILCYAGMSAAIVGFALVGSFGGALVFLWLAGVLRSVAGPLDATWLNYNLDSSVRATVISMNAQTNAFGQIFGGPMVGAVATRGSLRLAMIIVGMLVAPLVWMTARASRQQI